MGDIFCTSDVKNLLKDKYVQILGSSNWRSVYKDLIALAQQTKFLETHVCKRKGEKSVHNDKLLEGGLNEEGVPLNVGISYREKRLYSRDGIKISFEFITRAYNDHVKGIIEKLKDEKPDILLLNSALWDMSWYRKTPTDETFVDEFKTRVTTLLKSVKENVDEDTLVIWCAEMPIGNQPSGALFYGQTQDDFQPKLRYHVKFANDFVQKKVEELGFDFIDFHFLMKPQVHRQVKDDIHWDNTGLRRITNILLTHISEAYGVDLPGRYNSLWGIPAPTEPTPDINQNQVIAVKTEEKRSRESDSQRGESPLAKQRRTDASTSSPAASATTDESETSMGPSTSGSTQQNFKKDNSSPCSTRSATTFDSDWSSSASAASSTGKTFKSEADEAKWEKSIQIEAIDDVNSSKVDWKSEIDNDVDSSKVDWKSDTTYDNVVDSDKVDWKWDSTFDDDVDDDTEEAKTNKDGDEQRKTTASEAGNGNSNEIKASDTVSDSDGVTKNENNCDDEDGDDNDDDNDDDDTDMHFVPLRRASRSQTEPLNRSSSSSNRADADNSNSKNQKQIASNALNKSWGQPTQPSPRPHPGWQSPSHHTEDPNGGRSSSNTRGSNSHASPNRGIPPNAVRTQQRARGNPYGPPRGARSVAPRRMSPYPPQATRLHQMAPSYGYHQHGQGARYGRPTRPRGGPYQPPTHFYEDQF